MTYARSAEGEARRLEALRSPDSRAHMSEAKRGKTPKNFHVARELAWAANRKEVLTYSGIHKWVTRTFGQPDACEHCTKAGLSGRSIHWANKSGEYKRDRSDWMRLCRPCHFRHDRAEQGVDYFGGRNLPPIES